MSDLFHPLVPDEFISRVGRVMSAADWHVYQVLTKRPERMCAALDEFLSIQAASKHVWWGVSVENRKHGLPRVELLRASKAAMKFLSVEPLLEDLGTFDLTGIDWVIVGGESGPGARPIQREWIIRLRDQCAEANVPFFFKQWGGTRKHLTGNVLDGEVHQSLPPVRRKYVPALSTRQRRIGELQLLIV